jgi:predicted dehydrogenase
VKPVRLGVIGCGNVLDAYLPQCHKLRQRGQAELVLAAGRAAQKDRALALGAPRFTTNADDVLNSPEVDLVLVLTSMNEHARLAGAALEAGKHVLVEKPLATSLEDAASLVALAQRSRGHLLCAPFTILSSTFQTIARRIRCGDIGKPCSARARYGWAGPWWAEWFYKPGGGCLFDLGVYGLTSLTGLLGPARRVTAFTGVAIPEREINGRKIRVEAEDNAQVLLDFGDACFGVVTSGFTIQQYRAPALEIYGTSGVIQMLGDDWDPDGYELFQNSAGCWQVFKETDPDWPWADGLRHLVECIHRGERPLVTPEHSRHVLEIMLKAQQAGREGRALAIESTFAPLTFADPKAREAAHLMHDRSRKHDPKD